MRVYEFEKNKIYISSEVHDSIRSQLSEETHSFIKIRTKIMTNQFTKRKLVKKLLENYSKKTDLEGFIMLDAHGTESNPWTFKDGYKDLDVQNWIDKIDGNSLAILLYICNPKNLPITSKKSIVIHSNKNILLDKLGFFPLDGFINGKNIRIYFPNNGYLDSYYKLKKVIESLG